MIDIALIDTYFLQQPEVSEWPVMQAVWQHYAQRPGSWRLPELTCQAVGGQPEGMVPLVTAVASSYISIVLVDDILDADPKGFYQRLGAGVAANLALGFQALSYRMVQAMKPDVVPLMLAELVYLNLKTAQGQHLDVQEQLDEAHYWATVEAKSMPYYGAGFYLGALAGGADTAVAQQLRQFGQLVGKLIQVSDDLADAYQTPACPDWQRSGSNLAILYARLADHPGQARFEALLANITEPSVLEEAQQILLNSGAASYCVYHMMQIAQKARTLLDAINFAHPEILRQFLAERVTHLFDLLAANNLPLPKELAAALLV